MFFDFHQRSNDALREELLDYLLEARRAELLFNKRKELAEQLRRYRNNHLVNDQSSDDSDDNEQKTCRHSIILLFFKQSFIFRYSTKSRWFR